MKKDSFTHTGCKRGWARASRRLCVWASVRSVLFVGKSEFRFQRFKKGSRALANRAKTHCLDQNRQSLDYIAHRSNHWANATNQPYKFMKQCDFYSWNAKKKNCIAETCCVSAFATHNSNTDLGDEGMAPDKDGTCLLCPNLSLCQEITRAYVLVQQHQLR